MKKCSNKRCEVIDPVFHSNRSKKHGLHDECSVCVGARRNAYYKTKVGLISRMYSHQKEGSVNRKDPSPYYTKKELTEWLFDQPLFHSLYDNWVKSRYNWLLKPSCDRTDPNGFYAFSNMTLMTYKENREKEYRDRRNGVNNKANRAVVQIDSDGNIVGEYYSQSQAHRDTGINAGNINSCCKGGRQKAGGYTWKYL